MTENRKDSGTWALIDFAVRTLTMHEFIVRTSFEELTVMSTLIPCAPRMVYENVRY